MVKKLLLFLIISPVFLCILNAQSQDFNSELKKLTDQIILKISDNNKNKIAVWDFTDLDGNVISIGKYISEQVSVDFSNSNENFQVMDRNHLQTVMKEHKLNAEGFIDPNTAKELGKFAQVDFIVTGKITVLTENINLTMKAINTESAMINASVSGNIPMDENVKDLLGISSNSSRGFNNRAVNSNEKYNNPETVNKECEKNNTGDCCFENKLSYNVQVELINKGTVIGQIILSPDQTQCFYGKPATSLEYSVQTYSEIMQFYPETNTFRRGEILIEKCKSKTFEIK